jgi:hypothetical protein
MSKVMLFRILALAALMAPDVATAQTSVPDLRGTWTGASETVVVGGGNTHHPGAAAEEPEFRSVAFTLTIDKQEGRRLSGIFSSRAAATEWSPWFRALVQSSWQMWRAIPAGLC